MNKCEKNYHLNPTMPRAPNNEKKDEKQSKLINIISLAVVAKKTFIAILFFLYDVLL